MDKHKSADRKVGMNTYKPRSLAIKQKWGNLSAISTGQQNCMSFGCVSISATCTFNFQVQVYYNTLLKGGEANKVLVHTLQGTANKPFFVALPIKGEIIQFIFSGRDGATPGTDDTLLVNTILGNSTAYKVIP